MDQQLYATIVFWLTLGGVLFSGYLTARKFITKVCAFNEPCPYFLGRPACVFGFAMFFIMFCMSVAYSVGVVSGGVLVLGLLIVSFLGILFAGQYVVPEMMELIGGVSHKYTLGLSTCSYGFIFFLAIFIISVIRYLS